MSMLLEVRSRPGDVAAVWASTGFLAGLFLGSACGLAVGVLAPPILPITVGVGCTLGMFIGSITGTLNGLVLALLTRPLALGLGHRWARARAAAVAAVTTWLILLPAQIVLATVLPLPAVLAPITASVLVAAIVALRLPPAGRIADKKAIVRIQTL
jgi:hypothetical protein